MSLPRTVAQVLAEHVTLEVEGIDRMYLNVYVPQLQREQGVASFFRFHRGHPFASSALMDPISKTWFQLLCLGTGAVGLWTIYRLRMRRHSALMTARFDERMAERNRLSGELHDTLLQSVQASKMLVNTTLESRSADAAHMRR